MGEPARVIAKAMDFDQARHALLACDFDRLPASRYSSYDRVLRAVVRSPDPKIAYLSNFTVDLLPAYVNVHCARDGLAAGAFVGGFNQYHQEVLAKGSSLAAYEPGFVFLSLSARLLRPQQMAAFSSLSAAERAGLRDDILSHVEGWITAALRELLATVLLTNFLAPSPPGAGIADLKSEYGETEFFADLNLALLRRYKTEARVQLLDLDGLASRFGKARATDPRMYHLAKMEWSEAFLPALAEEILRHVKAARNLTKKCLVLDLDNTLWGGVLGEEGPMGVKIGSDDPLGEAYHEFQLKLRAIRDRGVLLALCSKNNPSDVEELFRLRSDMPLRKEDFAAVAIGWEPKHVGLAEIARTLNIGTDSLVFVDDNPAETALINQLLPEVQTVLLPRDPAQFANTLGQLTAFEKVAVLREDAEKTGQYRQMRERHRLQSEAGDLQSYLVELGTRITIRRAAAADVPRVHQLFNKTNQFNLTTKRYGLGEVEALVNAPDYELGVVSADDRFGELGMIAVYLLRDVGDQLEIDSFLMSCRAMGRGIESAIMNRIKERLLERPDLAALRGSFVPTKKNLPAAGFYEAEGFRLVEQTESGGHAYILPREGVMLKACPWIAVTR